VGDDATSTEAHRPRPGDSGSSPRGTRLAPPRASAGAVSPSAACPSRCGMSLQIRWTTYPASGSDTGSTSACPPRGRRDDRHIVASSVVQGEGFHRADNAQESQRHIAVCLALFVRWCGFAVDSATRHPRPLWPCGGPAFLSSAVEQSGLVPASRGAPRVAVTHGGSQASRRRRRYKGQRLRATEVE